MGAIFEEEDENWREKAESLEDALAVAACLKGRKRSCEDSLEVSEEGEREEYVI